MQTLAVAGTSNGLPASNDVLLAKVKKGEQAGKYKAAVTSSVPELLPGDISGSSPQHPAFTCRVSSTTLWVSLTPSLAPF